MKPVIHNPAGQKRTARPAPAAPAETKVPFPLRAKPEFYKRTLYAILTSSEGMADSVSKVRRVVTKIEKTQAEQLNRALGEEETRLLRLTAYRDMRTAIMGLSLQISSQGKASDTQLRRTKNVVYLRWHVEKEILMLHLRIELRELEDRQVRSGLRMSQFLEQSLANAGLA